MVDHQVHVALVSGGMYDRLYETISQFEHAAGVSIAIGSRGPHPELNAHLAANTAEPYDLISTHTKIRAFSKAIPCTA